MATKSSTLALVQILDAVERFEALLDAPSAAQDLQTLRADWIRQNAAERIVEIVSEASRRLTPEWKARFVAIPWQKIASIGNVLRHNYDEVDLNVIVGLKAEGHIARLKKAVETLLTEQEPDWRRLREDRRARAAVARTP